MSSPTLQGTWEVVIHRPVLDVWRVLDDSANLPRWCDFFVKETTGGKEGLGATRECTLETGGRRGRVYERCVAYEPQRRILWTMERDTLGITGMLRDFTFGFSIAPEDPGHTRVVFEQRWRPATLLARVLVPLVMRRQMARTNEQLLQALKAFVERSRAA